MKRILLSIILIIMIHANGCFNIKDNKLKNPDEFIVYAIIIKTENIINFTIFLPYSENWTTIYNDVGHSRGNATFRVEETIYGNVLSVYGTNDIHYVFYTEYNDNIYFHFTLIDYKIDQNVTIFCEKTPTEGSIYLKWFIYSIDYGGAGPNRSFEIIDDDLKNGWECYTYNRDYSYW